MQTKRDLLVKVQTQLKHALEGKEDEGFSASMLAIAEDIRLIEQKMDEIITSDHELKKQNELLQSHNALLLSTTQESSLLMQV